MPVKQSSNKQDTMSLITKKQQAQLIKMFKEGAILEVVLSYLGLTMSEAFAKRNVHSVHYDGLFARTIELGEVHSHSYWFKYKESVDARIWMAIMKNNFGWNGGATNRSGVVSQLNYNPDKPAETMDRIIQAVARDEISPEKAKVLTDTIINSYNVRCIENS